MQWETRWTLIEGAASGDEAARREFVARYEGPVRAYLGARWRDTPLRGEIDDAAQEVFLQCFRDGGALARADAARGGFRPFLYGVVRREAQKVETLRAREYRRRGDDSFHPDRLEVDETTLSRVFDRRWAQDLIEAAGELFLARARELGADGERRAELLQLRYHDQLPVREIAGRWNEDAARLHRELSRAKGEFQDALREAVAAREGYAGETLDRECARVLELLG
jgi:RNA polymerase sigma-70 factor (ECF subfamily)